MGISRAIDRSVARKLYDGFSKKWRSELRFAGRYGKPGTRKPTFNQWFAMHQKDLTMMSESTPADVREYLGADPWLEGADASPSLSAASEAPSEERGVMTIPMHGGEDE